MPRPTDFSRRLTQARNGRPYQVMADRVPASRNAVTAWEAPPDAPHHSLPAEATLRAIAVAYEVPFEELLELWRKAKRNQAARRRARREANRAATEAA